MLTKVILEGQMGKEFGREWEFEINSPGEALKMIEANKPGIFTWIRNNLEKHSHYRVVCEFTDGRMEELNNESFALERKLKSIRYVPLLTGAGGDGQMVLGFVLFVVGAVYTNPNLMLLGASLMMGSMAQALSPVPDTPKDTRSFAFNGPTNTTQQGVPVQLIYGKVLVGSHTISSALTIGQMMSAA